ncbi:hypothetical protein STEG23_029214 [Scotinomys teguina]
MLSKKKKNEKIWKSYVFGNFTQHLSFSRPAILKLVNVAKDEFEVPLDLEFYAYSCMLPHPAYSALGIELRASYKLVQKAEPKASLTSEFQCKTRETLDQMASPAEDPTEALFCRKSKEKGNYVTCNKMDGGNWRDGPVVKNTCCSSNGPGFGSQHPHSGSQLLPLTSLILSEVSMATARARGPVLEKMRTPWEKHGKRRQKSPAQVNHVRISHTSKCVIVGVSAEIEYWFQQTPRT